MTVCLRLERVMGPFHFRTRGQKASKLARILQADKHTKNIIQTFKVQIERIFK